MTIRVSGKNIDLGDVLRIQAETRIKEMVSKYIEAGFSGHVTISKDGIGFKSECSVHFDHGPVMHVSSEAVDPYQSVNIVIERLGSQLRRIKRKRAHHHEKNHGEKINKVEFLEIMTKSAHHPEEMEDDIVETSKTGSIIIAEPVDKAPSYTLSEAVNKMEREKNAVLVFRNTGTGRINVLYLRPDRHFSWVDIG